MSSRNQNKKETLNPHSGRKMNIDADRYDIIHSAICKVLKGQKLSFTEIVDGVTDELKKSKTRFEGVIPWYTITVKNDMHSRGEVEVIIDKGKKWHQLVSK